MRWQLPFLIFLIIATVLIVRHQRDMPYQQNSGMVFSTIYNITYQCDSDLQWSIEQELKKVDQCLSPFNETSLITAINNNKDTLTDKTFEYVFNLALKVSEETGGDFDITVAPLVNAWGFGFKEGITPTQQQIDSLKEIIGYGKVKLQNHKVIKDDKRIMLDCSAIAKGYACDAVASMLARKGVENYMVEIGGEVVTRGVNKKREEWRIGVEKPQDIDTVKTSELQAVIAISDKALATSGNYRNFYYKDGKKYAHTIDPHTGKPVQHNILSATVVAKDCATADAYATAFMVMGLEKAKKILENHNELKAYIIYNDDKGNYQTWSSPKLKVK